MINEFIDLIKNDINLFIANKKGVDDVYVLFTNLNNVLENPQAAENKMIISIVNIEEDRTIQNLNNYVNTKSEVVYKNQDIWLNITCLFTFHSSNAETYDGVDLLEMVVQYFQSRSRLDKYTVFDSSAFPANLENIRVEFVSLNYEQTSCIWSLFGGKYQPSVIYKFKALAITNFENNELPVSSNAPNGL